MRPVAVLVLLLALLGGACNGSGSAEPPEDPRHVTVLIERAQVKVQSGYPASVFVFASGYLGTPCEELAHTFYVVAARRDRGESQKEQIGVIRESYSERTAALFEALRSERGELAKAVHAEQFDEALVRAAASRVAVVEADLAVQRARIASDIRQVLTPEQVQKADELRQLFHEFAGQFHGRGGRGPWHRLPSTGEQPSD